MLTLVEHNLQLKKNIMERSTEFILSFPTLFFVTARIKQCSELSTLGKRKQKNDMPDLLQQQRQTCCRDTMNESVGNSETYKKEY